VARPELIDEITKHFGAQVLVLSLDARRTRGDTTTPSGFEVTTHGGRTGTGIDAVAWAKEAAERGVGEILLNSIDADGTKNGFDLELIRAVRAAVTVPLIASGGAGAPEHFPPAVEAGGQCGPCRVDLPLRACGRHRAGQAGHPGRGVPRSLGTDRSPKR
jgi:cyclase